MTDKNNEIIIKQSDEVRLYEIYSQIPVKFKHAFFIEYKQIQKGYACIIVRFKDFDFRFYDIVGLYLHEKFISIETNTHEVNLYIKAKDVLISKKLIIDDILKS